MVQAVLHPLCSIYFQVYPFHCIPQWHVFLISPASPGVPCRMPQYFKQELFFRQSTGSYFFISQNKVCGVFDNSGIHSLNGQQFKTHWTEKIISPPKFGPSAQKSFWYCPNFVCLFLFHFLRIEILELTATKHMWIYLHLNATNKFSFMNVLVQPSFVPWTPPH